MKWDDKDVVICSNKIKYFQLEKRKTVKQMLLLLLYEKVRLGNPTISYLTAICIDSILILKEM